MGLLKLGRTAHVISQDASVLDAARAMSDAKVGALVVAEGRRVDGIFSERDLMRRVVVPGKDPATTRVREVMSSPVQTVVDATPLTEAVAIMRANHIRHLVIVDGHGELAGIIGLRYLLYELMDQLQRKVGDLHGYLMADAPGG
jgi:CBS domain-containing protein